MRRIQNYFLSSFLSSDLFSVVEYSYLESEMEARQRVLTIHVTFKSFENRETATNTRTKRRTLQSNFSQSDS